MIVCHCNAVSERRVRAAIRAGASSRAALTRRCGAGGLCGGCVPALEALLASESARRESAPEPAPESLPALASA